MFAKTADELRELMKKNPGASPSTFLMDDSFAAWCYDHRDISWLKAAFNRDADPDECWSWGISAAEWKMNIEMARLALAGK